MKVYLINIALIISICSATQSMQNYPLSEEDVTNAITLAKSTMTCETFREEQKKKEKEFQSDYFSLEDFHFTYKNQDQKLYAAVGMDFDFNAGKINIYPGNAFLQHINFRNGNLLYFERYGSVLATLTFEYVHATTDHVAYMILAMIEAGYMADGEYSGGKGYAQASVSYFLNEFIIKHSQVDFVFSDGSNHVCRHFFPRYGLQAGIPEV